MVDSTAPPEQDLGPIGGRVISQSETQHIADVLRSEIDLIGHLYKSVLRKGIDYGQDGGARKPFLYQPGAEQIAKAFKLGVETEIVKATEDLAGDYFSYMAKAIVRDQSGRIICEKMGVCNSEESQYRRQGQRKRWRESMHEEGYGAAEQAETLIQMAQKRGYVAAVLRATAASFIFTMDDDLQSVRDSTSGPATDQGHGICALHGVALRQTPKQKEFNYPASHKDGDGYCNGKPAEGAQADEPPEPTSAAATEFLGVLRQLVTDGFEAEKDWVRQNFPEYLRKGAVNLIDSEWSDMQDHALRILSEKEGGDLPW